LKVLITRSREGNEGLAEMLEARGHVPIKVDVLSFEGPQDWGEVDRCLGRLPEYDWVVFTSATGVRAFLERAKLVGIRADWQAANRVAAVGDATARLLKENGVRVDFVPSRFLTAALAEELPGPGRVLLLRAGGVERGMAGRLQERGFTVEEVPVYETRFERVQDARALEKADIVLFGSPSAVEGLCSQLTESALHDLVRKPAGCVGPVTARAASAWGFSKIIQPERHTFDALVDAITEVAPSV
jgi:uroporphyrinogen-III synthase